MKQIKAIAPATVANVSCGFDVLGFAVAAPCDEVIVTLTAKPGIVVARITGDGGRLPTDSQRNTASVAIQSLIQTLGYTGGVEVELIKKLPLGSGMGSSAASAAAALVAINQLLGNPVSREELVPHAMEAERIACGSAHADNVAPSILGGFVLIRECDPLDVVRVPLKAKLFATLVHPHIELRTEDARRVLKPTVSRKDAIRQNGNVAGLMVGLMTADYELISRSLQDLIAEPVRSVFIPGFERMKQLAKDAGALGCGISGSGPTLYALSVSEEVGQRIGEAQASEFRSMKLASDIYVSEINYQGATCVK